MWALYPTFLLTLAVSLYHGSLPPSPSNTFPCCHKMSRATQVQPTASHPSGLPTSVLMPHPLWIPHPSIRASLQPVLEVNPALQCQQVGRTLSCTGKRLFVPKSLPSKPLFFPQWIQIMVQTREPCPDCGSCCSLLGRVLYRKVPGYSGSDGSDTGSSACWPTNMIYILYQWERV